MEHFTSFDLRQTGTMPVRNSSEIKASYCGVGCETLDRDYFDPVPVFPQLPELGVKWARLQTGWIKCEREPGKYDFSWLDWQVDTLLKSGIQPWLSLSYGNPLYTPEAGPSAEQAVGQVPLNTPEAETAWLNYVKALTAHFRDRVQVYEVWNEPNHPKFWVNLPIGGDQYARLFESTQAAIREVFPEARIAALAMTGAFLSPAGHKFTREFFENITDPDSVDIVTFHSYRYPPDRDYAEDFAAAKALVAEYNPRAELWQGESGYPSQPGGTGAKAHRDRTSEVLQAKWLSRHVLCHLGLGIKHVSWHQAIDLLGYREPDKVNPKGLLRAPKATRKPSFYVYQRICGLFDADTQPVRRRWRAHVQTTTADCLMPTVKAFHFQDSGRRPYITYWKNGEIALDEEAPDKVDLWVAGDWSRAELLDPYTGNIYQVDGTSDGEGYSFALPVTDYALILRRKGSP